MKATLFKTLLVAAFSLAMNFAFSQEDAEGCKDHSLFNRMPNYYLYDCDAVEFGAMKFPVGNPDPYNEDMIPSESVEGKLTVLNYFLEEDKTAASGLQIMRNFQNAARQHGGDILGEYQGWCSGYYEFYGADIHGGTIPFGNGCTHWGTTIRFSDDNKEIWVYVQLSSDGYDMVIAEKEAMEQHIQASEMFERLHSGEALTLYINFETASSAIKSESHDMIEELYVMLNSNPDLNIIVEGHTDNVGNPASNMTLSEQRAASVKTFLVDKGVPAERIKTVGYGQDKPVADNSTEEGKAKNRRVEIRRM